MANKISGNLARICPRERYTNRTDLNLGKKKKREKFLKATGNNTEYALKTCSTGITTLK